MNETLYNFGRAYHLDFDSLDILGDILKRRESRYTSAIRTCLKKLTDLEKVKGLILPLDMTEYDDVVTFETAKCLGMSVSEHTVMVFLVKAEAYRCEPEVQKSYLRMCLSLVAGLKQSHKYFLNPNASRGKRFFDTVLAVGPDFEIWKKRVEEDLEDLFEEIDCCSLISSSS
jgi:hypothetical protein